MKTSGFYSAVGAVAVSIFITQTAHAQVPQIASDSGTELFQLGTNDNGKETITKAPQHLSVNTKTLLEDLALDETSNGTWFAGFDNKVPPGAKVQVEFAGLGNFSGLSYKVVHGAETVDASNLISAKPSGANALNSSSYTDAGGPNQAPYTKSQYLPFTISYDARPVGGSLWFNVTGVATCTTTASKPNAKGVYTETDSFSLASGTGSGEISGGAFLLTGVTVTATGSGKLQGGAPAAQGPEETSIGTSETQIGLPPLAPLTP